MKDYNIYFIVIVIIINLIIYIMTKTISMEFLKIYKYYSFFYIMKKLFHIFSINNTKRNINVTKLDYIDKLYEKDINNIFELYNNKSIENKISLENIKYLNEITKRYDIELLYDNYIIIKDAIILNNNENNEFFCIKLLFDNNDIEIYVISGNIDKINLNIKFDQIVELSLT